MISQEARWRITSRWARDGLMSWALCGTVGKWGCDLFFSLENRRQGTRVTVAALQRGRDSAEEARNSCSLHPWWAKRAVKWVLNRSRRYLGLTLPVWGIVKILNHSYSIIVDTHRTEAPWSSSCARQNSSGYGERDCPRGRGWVSGITGGPSSLWLFTVGAEACQYFNNQVSQYQVSQVSDGSQIGLLLRSNVFFMHWACRTTDQSREQGGCHLCHMSVMPWNGQVWLKSFSKFLLLK